MQAEVVLESPRIIGVARAKTRTYVAYKQRIEIYGLDWELERTAKIAASQIVHMAEPDLLMVVGGSRARVYSGDLRQVVHTFDSGSVACCAASQSIAVVASKRRIRWWGPSTGPSAEGTLALAAVKAIAIDGNSIYCVQHDQLLVVDLVAQVVRQVPLRFKMGWTSSASVCTTDGAVVLAVDERLWLVNQLLPTELPGSFVGVVSMGEFWLGWTSSEAVLFKGSQEIDRMEAEVVTACAGLLATKDRLLSVETQITSEFVVGLAAKHPKLALRLGSQLDSPEILELRTSQASEALERGEYTDVLELLQQAKKSPLEIAEVFAPLVDELAQQRDVPSPSSATSRLLIPVVEAIVPYLSAQHRHQLLRPVEEKTMQAVDTLLFKCYCVSRSPLVGALVRNKNHCKQDLVVATLGDLGRWQDLAGFYKSQNNNQKALELLAQHDPHELLGFLEQIHDFGLVKQFSPTVLQSQPELAAYLFADSQYDPHQVYQFLAQQQSPYASEYLQQQIATSKDPRLHQDMALWYLDNEPSELNQFLSGSCVNPHTLLPKIPKKFYEARTTLLSKMGRHTEVIDLFIDKRDFERANKYAEQHHQVLNYLWERIKNKPERLELLNSVGHLLDHSIVGQLPSTLTMEKLGPYFEHLMQHLQAKQHVASLTCALSSTHVAQSTYQLAHLKDQRFEVDATTTCAQCKKRLGLAVAATWKGSIVHYGCISR